MRKIHLSPPHLSGNEPRLVSEAFASNWIAPLGPHVDAFECEVAQAAGSGHGAALSSGTAALHLALKLLEVGRGDEVFCSTFTFIASANPILYEGASPVFIDSEAASWNLDPDLLAAELRAAAARGRLPKAVIAVDLYGQCADYDRIEPLCAEYGVPLVEDAAEALGSRYRGRPAGSFGDCAAFSFNGNKIITASGGGMLVSRRAEWIERARFLAAQARDPAPHYQHSTAGYNYRMSNILAAIGRGQLRVLDERVEARRRLALAYREAFAGVEGIKFMPQPGYGEPNQWLTCITLDPERFGETCDDVRLRLERHGIESRPVWKPLHLQPLFAGCRASGGAVAESIFRRGLCLPSGSSLERPDFERVCEIVLERRRA